MNKKEYLKQYYLKNKEKYLQRQRDKIEEDKEKFYEDQNKSRKKHWHKRLKYAKAWRSKNREKLKQQRKEYFKIDKNRKRKNVIKITARKINLKNKSCEKCGIEKNLHRHHNNYNNPFDILILCVKCHFKWHKYNTPYI